MRGSRHLDWLGLTPEPQLELPVAVAALRANSRRPPRLLAGLADAERRRIEQLILRGTRRSWLRYLEEVTELVIDAAADVRPSSLPEATLAGEVVLDHHRMLIGLPGSSYERTARDRMALERALQALRSADAPGDHL